MERLNEKSEQIVGMQQKYLRGTGRHLAAILHVGNRVVGMPYLDNVECGIFEEYLNQIPRDCDLDILVRVRSGLLAPTLELAQKLILCQDEGMTIRVIGLDILMSSGLLLGLAASHLGAADDTCFGVFSPQCEDEEQPYWQRAIDMVLSASSNPLLKDPVFSQYFRGKEMPHQFAVKADFLESLGVKGLVVPSGDISRVASALVTTLALDREYSPDLPVSFVGGLDGLIAVKKSK